MKEVEPGERMLLPCVGGPGTARLVLHPPPLEIEVHGGMYVLEDEGPPERWLYVFIPSDRSGRVPPAGRKPC